MMVSPKEYKIINIGADLVVATVTKTASARRRNLLQDASPQAQAQAAPLDTVTVGQTNLVGENGASCVSGKFILHVHQS